MTALALAKVRRGSAGTPRTWRMKGPSGDWMETTAPSLAKARSNLRYRLTAECGMSRYDAARYDMGDLREVRE